MKTVGEIVRSYRDKQDMTLKLVADQLGIDVSYLSRIERGDKRPTRRQVVMLAQILNINEQELLIAYLSDKVFSELKNEVLALKVMRITEKKIKHQFK